MKCMYSNCDQWRGVKQIYSFEESYVNLCKRHIALNLKRGTISGVN